ncbi:MAG: ring-cleaving dioxygenase [Acidobacteria bacterium]|nr:MAG: ring-cleaving dioxygenase [Acidobacteriota bacterium]
MEPPVRSLHHVTATVDDAQDDLDFCLGILGLRLVKKTVNFDNHHVYHFYYGNECGTPGTLWTTFPYRGKGVPVGKKGAGQIDATSFSVPTGSLDFWRARLERCQVVVTDLPPRFGEEAIGFSDPSGLKCELIATSRDRRPPWARGGVAAETAIRGLHSATLLVNSPTRSLELFRQVLGFEIVTEAPGRIRLAVNGDDPGRILDIAYDSVAPPGVNGLGTVHHVATSIADDAQQIHLRDQLLEWGCKVTEIRDRSYFRSIYFREPGGVLLEVATVGPGFALDEELESLGRALKLPPWEEPHRQEIEAGLAAVSYKA